MAINAVTKGTGPTQVAAPTKETQTQSAAQTKAKDNAIISEKAKDLAALMAGKQVQEELSESPAAKAKEQAQQLQ